jgi:DNA-binding XRE family transcriptional regulator
MTPKKRVENLVRLLRESIPRAEVAVDAPSRMSGNWFVDVRAGKQVFAVEFRPAIGFGLSSTPSEGLGEGPDEFVESEEGVVERIRALLRSKARTVPQRVRLLQELREKRHISQVDVADKLGVRQPTVSKIERREDVNLGTLRRYIRALGGELHILARFKDESVEIGVAKPKKAASR